MKRVVYLLPLLIFPLFVVAQRDWDAVEIAPNEVTGNINFLTGSGGNIGVLYGDDGIMLVDDQYAPLSEKIKAAVSELSTGDIKFVVSTHYHGDHTGGNENFKKDGALIIGQENVRERLGTTFYSSVWDRDVEEKSESYWPVITFDDDMTLHLNGEEVQLVHTPSAHTDGDALVYFKTSNVIHCGDAFVRYGYPFIDIAAGGSIDGIIAAQEKILALANADTKIIPGHGELATIEDVKELLAMLNATRQIVADAKSSGEKMEDLIGRNPLEAYHERWSGNFIDSDLFVQLIYESL